MIVSTTLIRAAKYVDDIEREIDGVTMCAGFLTAKLADETAYPQRTVPELTAQLLEAAARLAKVKADTRR